MKLPAWTGYLLGYALLSAQTWVMGADDAPRKRVIQPEVHPDFVRPTLNLSYADTGNPRHTLDIYAPTVPSETLRPLIVMIHGGGWNSGDKFKNRHIVYQFVEAGYVVASVGYRLEPEVSILDCVQDVKAGIRWLRAQGTSRGYNPGNIIVWGSSAGAQLAGMVALSPDDPRFHADFPHADVSSRVDAWIGLAPPVRMRDFVERHPQPPETVELISPLNHVSADDPPALLIHAQGDRTVPLEQSKLMQSRYHELGLELDLFILPSRGHAFWNWEDHTATIMPVMQEFLEKQVQRRGEPPTFIPADHPHLAHSGAWFSSLTDSTLNFARFPPAFLALASGETFAADKARTTAGVRLRFTTDSPEVDMTFRILPGEKRGLPFALSTNGGPFVEIEPTFATEDVVSLRWSSASPDEASSYELLLPHWSNVGLSGIILAPGHTLSPNPPRQQPHYVAIGDSITHGTGLRSPAHTWPFQLAEARGWSLTNLAIGGSKVLPELAAMSADQSIDVITILIGYNDWNRGTTAEVYAQRLTALVTGLRARHPAAAIHCLTPLAARKAELGPNPQSGIRLEAYRDAVRNLVRELRQSGDDQIFLIDSGEVFTVADTRDGVHPSVTGARKLAEFLETQVQPPRP